MTSSSQNNGKAKSAPTGRTSPLPFPCTVIVDTREQCPFTFTDVDLRTDAKEGRRPIEVITARGTLAQGDYSLSCWESAIAIERKEMADLFQCCGGERDRFQRELERLQQLAASGPSGSTYAAVICEADWSAIIVSPPPYTGLNSKIVYRSVIAWQLRFPRIAWWFCPGRRFAEVTTFRLLERFWKTRGQHITPDGLCVWCGKPRSEASSPNHQHCTEHDNPESR